MGEAPRGTRADPDTETSMQSTVTGISRILFGSIAALPRLDGLVR
jgi:hypothetical protein